MRLTSISGFLVIPTASAAAMDEPKKDDKPPAVRALEVKLEGVVKGRFGEPTVITSPEELAKAITDEAAVAAIRKAVDFKTDKVLYFAWTGSGHDKLTFTTAEGKKGPEATFSYTPGKTRDIQPYKKLFALTKDATFKIAP